MKTMHTVILLVLLRAVLLHVPAGEAQPVITSQPADQVVAMGGTAVFAVGVSGTGPLTCQWWFQNAGLRGATNATLVLTNVQPGQAGSYSVVVSNLDGAVTSSNATLTVPNILIWENAEYRVNTTMTNLPASATNIMAMAAGDMHCLALKTDGTVLAWGDNYYGESTVPGGLTEVVSVAAGSTHSLALKRDGTLAAWGQLYATQTPITVPVTATNIAALAPGPGAEHALVLRADGTVLDWSLGNYGLTNIPANARNIVAVAAGATYGVALRADGTVVQWGTSSGGGSLPAIPTAATNIVAIATGWYGNAAMRADGTVLGWGGINLPISRSNFTNLMDVASLGYSGDALALRRDGTMVEYSSSVPGYPTNTITAIAAGSYNGYAVVGTGPPKFPGLPLNRTVASGSLAYFRMLAAGSMPISYQWTCAGTNLPGATNSILVLTNVQPSLAGSLYALVASNSFGLATSGPALLNETPSEVYVQASTTSAVVAQNVTLTGSTIGQGPFIYQWQCNGTNVPAATNLVLTLTTAPLSAAGTYSLIASNQYGFTTNDTMLAIAPTIITNVLQNQTIFPGGSVTFNLGLQAVIPVAWQWQFNGTNVPGATNSFLNLTNLAYSASGAYAVIFTDAYECVTNFATLSVVPVAAWGHVGQTSVPPGLTNTIAIANGAYHGLALSANGAITGWGDDSYGETRVPPDLTNVLAIAAGLESSFALATNGSVAAWGNNAYGQTNVPAGLSNVVAIAAGDYHVLALKSDGTVTAWGSDYYGQTNVPAGLTNIVSIAAGGISSMALRADGAVFTWGFVTNAPANATNAIQVATGGDDDLVLRADGSLVAWGLNTYGQDTIPSGLANVVAIAMGYAQSAALKSDGTVVGWGYNQYGQSTVPAGLANVTMLRGNGYQNLALVGGGVPAAQVLLTNCSLTASGFELAVPSQSGRVYALEYKDSLTDTHWTALPLVAGNGGTLELMDGTASKAQRFYRVRQW